MGCQYTHQQRNNLLKIDSSNIKQVKLIFCGSAGVGKTSIFKRYLTGNMNHQFGLYGGYRQKKILTKRNETIKLNLWDTAGDQRYHSLIPLYYRDTQIVFLVFDINDSKTFEQIDFWFKDLQEKARNVELICLIGNKNDLESRQISKEQGQLKASKNINCSYFQTSALTGNGIQQLFEFSIQTWSKKAKNLMQ